MKPVLFEILGLKIYGYGAMIALGILAAVTLLDKRSKKIGYNEEHIFNMSIVGIIGGILGGKLLYIIVDIKYIIENPEMLKDLGNGFVIYGAIIGGALAIYLYCKKKNWDVLKMFDLVIPSVALAQGFGRIGCFLAGCCYGKPTKLPIGVVFTNSPFAPSNIHLHPTQIYSSIFDFLLALFLLWYSGKSEKSGRTFSLYVIIYGVGRIIVEFLRGDPRGNVFILSTSQFISVFSIIAGILLFNIDRVRK